MANLLLNLDPESLKLVQAVGALADSTKAYLVGGPVRDLILKRPVLDLDITVEGNGIALAQAFAKHMQGKLLTYPAFKTATVQLPSRGRSIDFVTARKERYPKPGVFPVVTASGIKDDLFRRDFTINAIAIGISPAIWGKLVDPFGGCKDIQAKRLRIMHEKSFIDDPTRILRAARFAGRLDFLMERQTLMLLKQAVKSNALSTLKGGRYTKEVQKINTEINGNRIDERLKSWGVLPDGEGYGTHRKG